MSLIGTKFTRRSNAKTAYGLLTDMMAYALEEPKRLYMPEWIRRGDDAKMIMQVRRNAINELERVAVPGPACGIVGCVAGNALVLSGYRHRVTPDNAYHHGLELLSGEHIGGSAEVTKTPLLRALTTLFAHTQVCDPKTGQELTYGTLAYVKVVNKRIAKLQHDFARELRAVKIKSSRVSQPVSQQEELNSNGRHEE